MDIWGEAVATFIGNGLLVCVAFGFWKAQKVKQPDDSPGWVALLAVILPLMAVAGTLYVQNSDRQAEAAASRQAPALSAPAAVQSQS